MDQLICCHSAFPGRFCIQGFIVVQFACCNLFFNHIQIRATNLIVVITSGVMKTETFFWIFYYFNTRNKGSVFMSVWYSSLEELGDMCFKYVFQRSWNMIFISPPQKRKNVVKNCKWWNVTKNIYFFYRKNWKQEIAH